MLDVSLFRAVFYAFDQGFCVFEILVDADGRPVDYRFLEVNHAFERLTGLTTPVGRTAREMVPNLEQEWIDVYGRVAITGVSRRFELESPAMGRSFEVHASRIGAPEQRLVALVFNDITARRVAERQRQRALDAMRTSERRFRAFADTAPAMLWVTEADGSCSYLSRGWYDYTGQEPDEGLGSGWLAPVHPADRDATRKAFAEANARHEPFELEHRLHRADGTYRWVIDAGRPRIEADGRFAGYVGSVIDIHDRKQAEERLDLAVNSGRVGLWFCDLPFDVLTWNAQVKEHFGLPPDAHVTIDTFFACLHPDDREPTRVAIEAALNDKSTFDTQYRTVAPDGRVRWIRAIGRAQYDDERPVRFDGITIDVSELVALREGAEAANRAKDEFLAMLGHELRNPLAPISTALQLLKLRGVTGIDQERAVIERQVRHLVGLVDDLLDVSRITRGRVDLRRERVSLADVVTRALEQAAPILEQQRHHLRVDVPRDICVDGDADRLTQVVGNLLTNAAKFTEEGGRVSVSASTDDGEAVLRVTDSGMGIDEAMLPQVFEVFTQERQSLSRSRGGLGLGLAIVRSLVELHGGAVSADSAGRGAGATFTVRLPLGRCDGVADSSADDLSAQTPHAPTGMRVLVVDDNQDAASLLGSLLTTAGCDVRVVHDAPAALEQVEVFRPEVALIDIGLPAMDGLELARRLRAHPALDGTRLVAVTGYGQERDRHASLEAGFSAHLVKPIDAKALREVLSPKS